MKIITLLIGIALVFGHGNHSHSHGHGFKHKHKHSNHHHQHNHSHGGHHKHWSNLIKLHIAYDVLHHHNYQSSVYWHGKFMDVRTDLKLLWEDYNELDKKYDDVISENLELKRRILELEKLGE